MYYFILFFKNSLFLRLAFSQTLYRSINSAIPASRRRRQTLPITMRRRHWQSANHRRSLSHVAAFFFSNIKCYFIWFRLVWRTIIARKTRFKRACCVSISLRNFGCSTFVRWTWFYYCLLWYAFFFLLFVVVKRLFVVVSKISFSFANWFRFF